MISFRSGEVAGFDGSRSDRNEAATAYHGFDTKKEEFEESPQLAESPGQVGQELKRQKRFADKQKAFRKEGLLSFLNCTSNVI